MTDPASRPISDALERSEWAITRFMVATRSVAVLAVAADMRAVRGRLRRPTLARGAMCALLAHAWWASRRMLRQRQSCDPLVAASEVPVCIALLAVQSLVYDAEVGSTGPRLGTDYLGVAAGLASVGLATTPLAVSHLALLGVTVGVTGVVRPGSGRLETTVFDLLILFQGLMARGVIGSIRLRAQALDAAHDTAAREGARLAAERERRRHHRVVHDEVLQTLEVIAGGWGAERDGVGERLATQVRRLTDLVDAPGGHRRTLSAGIAELVSDFGARGLTIETYVDPEPPRLADEVEEGLLGAAREALENVCKHAGVDLATVTVAQVDGSVQVSIADHGCGFDPTAARPGFGLAQSIEARLRDLGGTARVASRPGGGTTVTLRVPR